MLKIANKEQLKDAHALLIEQFEKGNFETSVASITSPGGPIPEAKEYWSEKDKLWAWFRTEPFDPTKPFEERRWLCFYGTDLGQLTPSIQINIPVEQPNRRISGRVLVDASGNYYLGHKGRLGGGGDVISENDFAALIQGFEREPVWCPDASDESVFVIDESVFVIEKIGSPEFIGRLQEYVSESERIRKLKRQNLIDVSLKSASPHFKPESHGTVKGKRKADFEIKRYHGKVVNALKAELAQRKIKCSNEQHKGMYPDLYTINKDETLDLLFEIKTGIDTQAWFTAIGQLIVYGASQEKPPRRVLVCPAKRQDPNFDAAFESLKIELVFYNNADGEVSFEKLGDIVPT